MIPCNYCNVGSPYDGEYNSHTQCRFCWLAHNREDYRELWGIPQHKSQWDKLGTPEEILARAKALQERKEQLIRKVGCCGRV